MTDDAEQIVLEIFRKYQQARRRGYHISVLENALASRQAAPAETAKDPAAALYAAYQTGRDTYRASIFLHVMQEARNRLQERAVDTRAAAVYRAQRRRSSWLARGYTALLEWVSVAGYPRLAAAAVLITVVAVPFLFWSQHRENPVFGEVGAALIADSRTIGTHISPLTAQTFSFSTSSEAGQTAFRLGVAAVDLPLLARSNRPEALRRLSGEIMRTVPQDIALQSAYSRFGQAVGTPAADVWDASNRLAVELNRYFKTHKYREVYQLGLRIETLLLASHADDPLRFPWREMLRETRETAAQAKKVLEKIEGAPALIEKTFPNELGPQSALELEQLRAKILRLKAVLL